MNRDNLIAFNWSGIEKTILYIVVDLLLLQLMYEGSFEDITIFGMIVLMIFSGIRIGITWTKMKQLNKEYFEDKEA